MVRTDVYSKEVEGQRIRLSAGSYYLDEHLLKVSSTATDAETNKVEAIQKTAQASANAKT